MEAVAEVLRYVNVLILASIAVAAMRRWRAGAPGAAWVALAFTALTALFSFRLASRPFGVEDEVLVVVVAAAVLFPYLLFRFSAGLAPASRQTELLMGVATAVMLVLSLALAPLPVDEEPRPAWLSVFIVALLVQWALVLVVVCVRLWSGGRGQGRVARRRMRSLAFAAPLLVAAIAVAGLGPGDRPPALDLTFRLLVLASALMFFVAFSPPRLLRAVWRRPEEDRVRRAIQSLIGASEPPEVVATVLPPMADLVGARAVAVLDDDGRVLAAHGNPALELRAGEPAPADGPPDVAPAHVGLPLRLGLVRGSVLVWTSPYAPVFGDEELELLKSLGAFAEMALEHSRLFAQERDARRVLEQVDELKSGFIALASHELRGPAATVYGLAEILHAKRDRLSTEQDAEFRRLLFEDAARLVHLMDQLLDLSRLEAGAIEIRPERVSVRERVEELVGRVVAGRESEVVIDVDGDLQAVVDPNALERVVSNLVANALRYAEAPIVVAAEQRDRHFRLSVEDRGRGVPPELRPRLFERFARGGSTGTGLGLSIAQSYAQAHGGQLLYQPAEPHGARFELVLPHNPSTPSIRDARP